MKVTGTLITVVVERSTGGDFQGRRWWRHLKRDLFLTTLVAIGCQRVGHDCHDLAVPAVNQ